MKKRFLSTLLAFCLILSLLPVGAGAAAASVKVDSVTGGNLQFDADTGLVTGCDNTVTEALIPSQINGVNVTGIDAGAFADCTSLTSIGIPQSVASIGNGAFQGCTSLTSLRYEQGADEWEQISIGSNNDVLASASVTYCKIPNFDLDNSENLSATDPVLTLRCDQEVQSEWINKIEVDPRSTGLTFTGASLNGSTALDLQFSGTSQGGEVHVAIADAVPGYPDGTVSLSLQPFTIPAPSENPAPNPDPDTETTPSDPGSGIPDLPSTGDDGSSSGDGGSSSGDGGSSSGGSSSSGGGSSSGGSGGTKPGGSATPQDKPSPIQSALRTEENLVDWVERIQLPDYAEKFYGVLSGGSGASAGIFENQDNFTLPSTSGSGNAQVERVEVVEFSLTELYSGGSGFDSTLFQEEKFYTLSTTAADRSIDFSRLALGDLVTTASFNGVYVTKIPQNASFAQKKQEVCEYIAAVFHAFDRDHPEIFWLSGKCQARILVAKDPSTGTQTAYFFLVLADKNGFTMCAPAWTAAGSIAAGVKRRDAAADAILKTVTAGDTAGKVRQLNTWLTEHNQYNTTPDLTTIGNEPHECLAALEGRIGTQGPVCDGYSRAFKLLCDRLQIPCVLETGWAKATKTSAVEFHMWTLVQVGQAWYGADITWDDPAVKDFVGAKSGRENEDFLLVGADTVIREQAFRVSHVTKNQAAVGGVDFSNGPKMHTQALAAMPADPVSFDDVPAGHWAAQAITWAKEKGYMTGTSAATFRPDKSVTREQLWTIFARLSGEAPANYGQARTWAMGAGLSDGTRAKDSASRQELVTFLYRYVQARDGQVQGGADVLGAYQDQDKVAGWAREAMNWAVSNEIVTGTGGGALSPKDGATRAQFALILYRFLV